MAHPQNGESSKLFPIFQKNFRPKKNPDPLKEIQTVLDKSEQQERSKKRKCLLGRKETPGEYVLVKLLIEKYEHTATNREQLADVLGLTQLILDAGQKAIGPVHCEECGLLYSPGDIDDEREHRKAHSRLDNLFSIRLWKSANIVVDFPAEACMIVGVDCKTESKRVLNSLRDFLEWIDSELGGCHDMSGSTPSEKIYLYLFRTKRKNIFRILGCTIVETIEEDKIIRGAINPKVTENFNTPLLLGITRLWTDAAFRKRNIARRLCDVIRMTSSIPGLILSVDQIGILEPSKDGEAFMTRYTGGRGRFYTYK